MRVFGFEPRADGYTVTMSEHWQLPHDLTAGREARRRVRAALGERIDLDDIELVASELATNAAVHGRAPLELHLTISSMRCRVAVTNASGSGVPRVGEPSLARPSGRGLRLVDQLATDWGWSEHDGTLEVWAAFANEQKRVGSQSVAVEGWAP